jgi:hypothetical protein
MKHFNKNIVIPIINLVRYLLIIHIYPVEEIELGRVNQGHLRATVDQQLEEWHNTGCCIYGMYVCVWICCAFFIWNHYREEAVSRTYNILNENVMQLIWV